MYVETFGKNDYNSFGEICEIRFSFVQLAVRF